jgi:hypothetical protein
MLNRKFVFAAIALALTAPAQAQNWRVVAGESGSVVASNLPAGVNRSILDYILGDAGAGQFGFRVSSPTASAGYWAARNGVLSRYTELGVNSTLGPGRSGTESTHVFIDMQDGWGDAAVDGQRIFGARASDPASTTNATYGLWRWDLTRNIEVARVLSDGIYGPGLGSGWVFPNASGSFVNARMMTNGQVLIDASVNSPTGASSRLVAKHVPGQGNRPCLRSGSTDAALAPGLTAGDAFETGWTLGNSLSVTAQGRAYGRFSASGSRGGLWEICNGAPRAVAVNDEVGTRGPNIAIATATFVNSFYAPFAGNGNQFYFFSYFRPASGDSSRLGLFWHNGSINRGIALNESSGFYGPNWQGSTWRIFDTDSLSTAGQYLSFTGGVTTGDGGNPDGLWRLRAGQRPELVALIGLIGQYGPEPSRTWRSFGATAVLDTGSIIAEAYTDPGNEYALWLLEPGAAPRRILRAGDNVSVSTTTGTVQAAVSSFDLDNGGAQFSRGADSWIGADGTLMVVASLNGYGEVLLSSRPTDRIFRADND